MSGQATERADNALAVDDLVVAFPGAQGVQRAVDGVSLQVRRGDVLALIGESGSGKSTVLNAIAGLVPKAAQISGTLLLADRRDNLLAAGADRRGIAGREIGMIFQNPAASLNPVITIGQHIGEVLRAHQNLAGAGQRRAIHALLERVGIGDAARRAASYPHQLSGGLKQRVAIAAALAGRPRVLLADEPTTALDATVQAQILDLLLSLVDVERLGMIFVTHDLAVAASIADRIAVIYAGRIVESGPARTLIARPAHPYTAALARAALALAPDIDPAGRSMLYGLPGAAPTSDPHACGFAPRCALRLPACVAARPPLRPFGAGHVACLRPGEAAP